MNSFITRAGYLRVSNTTLLWTFNRSQNSRFLCGYSKSKKMLEPVMEKLDAQRIILASSSPRRQEILQNVGLKFEVIPSLYEEDLNPEHFETPNEFVVATAENKVRELEERLKKQGENYGVIIGADTIVYFDKKIYGKPKTHEEAKQTLRTLSGKIHQVFTGVCVRTPDDIVKFCEETKVEFGHLSDDVLEHYVKSGDPMDKAGGYGIQGRGGSLIARIEGDYFNVVGMPVHRLSCVLLSMFSNV